MTPMMAEYVDAEIDESKTYVIKIKDTQNYIFADGDKYLTYRTDTPYNETDTKFHFVFVKYNKTTYDDNSKLYYIQSVSSSKYAFRNGTSSYTGEPAVELATSKNNTGLWIVKKEGDTFKIIRAKYNNGFYENTNECWSPNNGDPISFSNSPSKSLVIEALDGSDVGGGESGGDNETLVAKKTELDKKITEANELLEKAGFSILPRQEVALQVTNPNAPFYLSSNADHNAGGGVTDGDGIVGLIDGDASGSNYFHTSWGGKDPGEAHYIQVDLGNGNEIIDFLFDYTTRDAYYNSTSPAPTKIEVYGGNSSSNVNNLITTFSRLDSSNPLPTHYDRMKKWTSNLISSTDSYRYLRFVVTESTGPAQNNKYYGYYFFCMAEFNLWLPSKPVVTNNDYKGQEDKLNELSQLIVEAKSKLSSSNLPEVETAIQTLSDFLSAFVTIGDAKWSSLVLRKNAAIPANVTAYVVSKLGSDWATLTEVEDVIPANEPVLLNAEKGVYSFEYVNDATFEVTNYLEGTLENEYIQAAENTTYYVLGVVDGVVGLYKALINKNATGGNGTTHFLNNANKAYLPVTTTQGANMMRFNFEETTGVEEVEVESTVKTIYDLSGRKVSSMSAPGLYIVNGKKVLVK